MPKPVKLPIGEQIGKLTVDIRITDVRRHRLRFQIGEAIMRLAAWVMGVKGVEISLDDPATQTDEHSAVARVKGDQIVITQRIENLQYAALGGWAGGTLDPYRIDDPYAFAAEMCNALNDEDGAGATPIHHLFDEAVMGAIERGQGEEISYDEAVQLLHHLDNPAAPPQS